MKYRYLHDPMAVVLTIALLIRVLVALWFQNIIAPDEVFQALEQAHRLVFGQGIVPWEFQVGLRCWLIPLLLAAPMALAHLVDPDPFAGLIFIRILLCIASLPIVWCATKWGERFHGARGAWIAGLFTALWPDLWLMAPHPLEEVLAADVLVPAVYLVESAQTLRRVAWAGFLLGLAFTFRQQLAPAIAVAGIFLCGKAPRRWTAALFPATLPVLVAGMLDWYSWGQPFRSFWLDIYLNIFLGVANMFGTELVGWFLGILLLNWLWAFPLILLATLIGTKKLPLAALTALTVIVVHSIISHKEYRFIFPAIALVIPLTGVGLATFTLEAKTKKAHILIALIWVGVMSGPLASPWTRFFLNYQTGSFQAFKELAVKKPAIVSLQGWRGNMELLLPFDILYGSQTAFAGPARFYTSSGQQEASAIVANEPGDHIPANFVETHCYAGTQSGPRICVWERPGFVISPPGLPPPVSLPFPPQAKPFIIRDRLTDR